MTPSPGTGETTQEGEQLLALGRTFIAEADEDQAELVWRAAIDLGSVDAVFALGELKSSQFYTDEAKDLYEVAAAAGHSGAMYELGSILLDEGEISRGTRVLIEAVELGSTDAMVRIATVHEAQGDFDRAEEWWEIAIGYGHVGARYQLGLLLYGQGELRAVDHWIIARDEGDQTASEALDTLAAGRDWVDPIDNLVSSWRSQQEFDFADPASGEAAVAQADPVEQRDARWQYLHFADEIERAMMGLGALRADTWTPARHLRVQKGQSLSSASEALEFVQSTFENCLASLHDFVGMFSNTQVAAAFDESNGDLDADRITGLAVAALSRYETMLNQLHAVWSSWSGIESISHLLNCLGELIEAPVAQCEVVLYEMIAGLRAVYEHGTPLTLSPTFDLDGADIERFEVAFDLAFRTTEPAPNRRRGSDLPLWKNDVDDGGASKWVDSVMAVPVVQQRVANQTVSPSDVERMLRVLKRNGSSGMSLTAFASEALLPPTRAARYLAQLVNVVNIDGYETVQLLGESVRFDAELLERQIGLRRHSEAEASL